MKIQTAKPIRLVTRVERLDAAIRRAETIHVWLIMIRAAHPSIFRRDQVQPIMLLEQAAK